jgi:hypothetical protein
MPMEMNWSRNRLGVIQAMGKLGAIFFLPTVLFFLPISYLDAIPTICLINNATGYACLGCGMTHAIVSVLHGNFEEALSYNWRVVAILPLLVITWSRQCIRLAALRGHLIS